jgi:hypothetical protein
MDYEEFLTIVRTAADVDSESAEKATRSDKAYHDLTSPLPHLCGLLPASGST